MKDLPPLHVTLATALALAIGWGIRGNFGHETGAMIPGALAAMAAVLLSQREDWWSRVPHFAFFGALGWSFGGSISYMQVIAYTHSGHTASVIYGFACLFVIGFLWAAMGGAGTALPAVLDRERLESLFVPIITVFGAWLVQDFIVASVVDVNPQFRHRDPLYWYDTDWLGVLVAIAAVLVLAAVRRRMDFGSSLVLHMAVGWWIGFLLLVVLLGWRMTPPRGDNWAGCVGMVIAMWIFFQRHGLRVLTWSSLVAGFIGGFGFAGGQLLKLAGLKTGWNTNWHSVLEQTYGFINGIGIAVIIWALARRLPKSQERATRSWTTLIAIVFVLVGITYLNLRKNVGTWVKANAMPEVLYGLSAAAWFNLAYAALAVLLVTMLVVNRRRTIALLPETALGRGQLLFLVFLWWMVVGNFERAVVGFAPQRIVTEGVIFLNAVICTALVLLPRAAAINGSLIPAGKPLFALRRVALIGTAFALVSIAVEWSLVRALYGDTRIGHASLHIRFGPDATATKAKPIADKPHP